MCPASSANIRLHVGTRHPLTARRSPATVLARSIASKDVSQPQQVAPSQRKETGPVARTDSGSSSSTMGPLREWRMVLLTGSLPRTAIVSERTRAGSHRPSYRNAPEWAGSVRSTYRSRCEQMLFVIPHATCSLRPNITAGIPA